MDTTAPWQTAFVRHSHYQASDTTATRLTAILTAILTATPTTHDERRQPQRIRHEHGRQSAAEKVTVIITRGCAGRRSSVNGDEISEELYRESSALAGNDER
jgi:hypothetical protein